VQGDPASHPHFQRRRTEIKRRKAFAAVFFGTLIAFTCASVAQGQSNDVFDPNGLVKNPYQFKGHSGILNTNGTPVLMPNGSPLRGTLIPFACMKFERMLDEHTAVYEVQAYEDGVLMPQGELAVSVRDSVAPDPSRRWRILVEGPMEGWNGFGAKITVTAIRFDGYYVPPPPTPEELVQQEAARNAQQARQAAAQQAAVEAQAKEQEWKEKEVERLSALKIEEERQSHQRYCDRLKPPIPLSFLVEHECKASSKWEPILTESDKFFIRLEVEGEARKISAGQ
jgi:hypothetical protein